MRREGAWILQELVDPSAANWSLVREHLFDPENGVRWWCVQAIWMRGDKATASELRRGLRVIEGLKIDREVTPEGIEHLNQLAAEFLDAVPAQARPHRMPTALDLATESYRLSLKDLELVDGAVLWTTESVYPDDETDELLQAHTGLSRQQLESIWDELARFHRRVPQPADGSATVGEIVDIIVRGGELEWRSDALDFIRNCLETLDARVSDGDLAVLHDATRAEVHSLLAAVAFDA